MFVKRTAQLKLLEEQYASAGNNLVILYGRKGLGKTTLLSQFMADKPAYYYAALECEDILQLSLLAGQWGLETENSDLPEFSDLLDRLPKDSKKKVIILDEFHYLLKNSADFPGIFKAFSEPDRAVMLILCSSSIRWVENEMIAALGNSAAYITSYMKLKEFSFVDFVNRFPKSSVESCIYISAILGGVPDYLDEWQEDRPVKGNILHILYNKNNRLFLEPQLFLKQELREPAVYNTILSLLAQGNRKLNDLHAKTGYSRAKISVYLKALIQLDLVEKLVPFNESGRENVQKGLYRIKDNFFSFWYRFVFPHLSELMLGNAEAVYEKELEPYLDDYMGEYFSDVCAEFLKLMNQHNRLPGRYAWWDRWYGKNGTIDILAQGEGKQTLVGKCLWEDRTMNLEDFDKLSALSKEAGLNPQYFYLFSRSGFSTELSGHAKEQKNIVLIRLEDL